MGTKTMVVLMLNSQNPTCTKGLPTIRVPRSGIGACDRTRFGDAASVTMCYGDSTRVEPNGAASELGPAACAA